MKCESSRGVGGLSRRKHVAWCTRPNRVHGTQGRQWRGNGQWRGSIETGRSGARTLSAMSRNHWSSASGSRLSLSWSGSTLTAAEPLLEPPPLARPLAPPPARNFPAPPAAAATHRRARAQHAPPVLAQTQAPIGYLAPFAGPQKQKRGPRRHPDGWRCSDVSSIAQAGKCFARGWLCTRLATARTPASTRDDAHADAQRQAEHTEMDSCESHR